ncbi:MAG: hypothetical protein ABI863_08745 [Ginsengibacter sp.]
MIKLLTFILIFSLLNGITLSIIFYLIKKYVFRKPSGFRKNIRIGVIAAIICFAVCAIFISSGMDSVNNIHK